MRTDEEYEVLSLNRVFFFYFFFLIVFAWLNVCSHIFFEEKKLFFKYNLNIKLIWNHAELVKTIHCIRMHSV